MESILQEASEGWRWNRETTIGRPRRNEADGGDAEKSQPASASRVPKPWAAGGGREKLFMRRNLDINVLSEEEKEPVRDVETERQRKREALEAKDRAELERNVKRWKKQTEEVESRFEGGPLRS